MATLVTQGDLGDTLEVDASSKLQVKIDSTSIVKDGSGQLGAASPTWDNVAKTITFPAVNGGTPQVIDLSQFVTDIYVDGGTFDVATSMLTLTDNDGGTGDIQIDLAQLLGVSTDAGNLLRNGSDGKALLTQADLGVCTDLAGTPIFRAFPA